MDVRKSLSVAFLAISDQYETLKKKVLQNGCRRPFWMCEIYFRSHFWPFQIDMQFFLGGKFLTKWLPSAILDVRNSLSVAFLAISDQYEAFFKMFYKMAAGAHFGCAKLTFDRISGHFRSICNFIFFGNF